jgi:hypothetical protein
VACTGQIAGVLQVRRLPLRPEQVDPGHDAAAGDRDGR